MTGKTGVNDSPPSVAARSDPGPPSAAPYKQEPRETKSLPFLAGRLLRRGRIGTCLVPIGYPRFSLPEISLPPPRNNVIYR